MNVLIAVCSWVGACIATALAVYMVRIAYDFLGWTLTALEMCLTVFLWVVFFSAVFGGVL
jgi:hypothetical protein